MSKVNKSLSVKKVFAYQKGNCSLSFELTDDRSYFNDFKVCLLEAIKDIDFILSKQKT